ncbi:TolC family protein [Campylobacter sp. MG1]|uniref:TolC family protein n=1 Tax=Campylobacter sp. MG1 TaxID=2976332 RepID=UPI00226D3174|nr:TolC family protein [Campylobacter sp. MG1]
MKKILLMSVIAASCLQASEYNIFVSSSKAEDYNMLNKIKADVEKIVNESKYANELIVKARPSNPVNPANSLYHTVVIETNDVSMSKAIEYRDYIRDNSSYKDAYITSRKGGKSVAKTEIINEEPVAPKKEIQSVENSQLDTLQSDDSTGSLLDSLAAKSENSLDIPEFNNELNEKSITLNKMISNIFDTNPTVNSSKQEYLKSLKDLDIASAVYYPMLNLYANAGIVKKTTKTHTDSKNSGKGLQYDASIVLTENLFNGGKDMNGKKEQNHITNSTAYKLIQNSNEVAYESTRAYLELIRTKLLLDIANRNVEAHEEIYSLIKDRTSSGFARASEERQAGSRLALAKNNLLSATNDYEDANSKFKRLFGNNVDINSLVMPEFKGKIPASLEELNEISKRCNPSIKVKAENINVYEYKNKVNKGNYLPKLDLELSAKYEKDKVFKDKTTNTETGAFLRFSYNLFNKGHDKLNVEKGKIDILSSQLDHSSILRELEESNEFAFNSYNISKDKINYLNDYVDYAKSTLLTYQDEFKIGKRDLINVLDAQSEYFTAVRELINNKNNILLTEYKMLNNMGIISESFVNGYAKQFISFACSVDDVK